MNKFVSFWAMFKSGSSFMGNMILSDFEIQNNEDIRKVESMIKVECNRDVDHHDHESRVDFVSLINWKAI